jgi:hypothetical protein
MVGDQRVTDVPTDFKPRGHGSLTHAPASAHRDAHEPVRPTNTLDPFATLGYDSLAIRMNGEGGVT